MHRNKMMSTAGDEDIDGYKETISSERLGKDVSNIMNSAFWIDALRKGYAKGMGDQLSSQLKSAHDFAHQFVHSYIELRRMSIKKHLMDKQFKQQQQQKQQQLQQTHLQLPQQQQHQQQRSQDLFNATLFEEYFQFIEFDEFDDDSESWLAKFLIEFSYLAILDFNDFLATSNLILNKITEWFPDFNISNKIRRGNFEKILKESNYFKRLMNVSKSNETTKPIILKKKQSIWSINQNHIKQFIKTFQRMKKKHITTHSTTKSAYLASSKFWKLRMEQVKLLIQIKHNGYLWFYSTKRIEYHLKERGTRCKLKVKQLKQEEDSPQPYHQVQTNSSSSPIFTNLLSPISPIISPTITPTTLFPQTPVTSIEHFFDIDFRSSDNELCIETL